MLHHLPRVLAAGVAGLIVQAGTLPVAADTPLGPKPPWITDTPTFSVPAEGSGWIPMGSIESGPVFIRILINGEPVRAILDTGVGSLDISKAFADAHHLPLTPWVTTAGPGGRLTHAYTTPNATVDIGNIHTTRPGVLAVVDLSGLASTDAGAVDAIIGLPLLGTLEWQVDQDHHRFRLLPSGALPIPVGIPIRTSPDHSRLVADVTIAGGVVPQVMIDTGADSEVDMLRSTAQAVGFRGTTDVAAMGTGGSFVQPVGKLPAVAIGPYELTGVYATVTDTAWFGEGIPAMIGMGLLRRYNMTVDLSAGRMALTPRAVPPPPMPKSTSGVQGPFADGRATIAHVMANSPAAAAGLKAGDAICAIDGAPMSQAMVDRHWGRGPAGTRYALTLCDGRKVPLTLRDFY